MTRAKKTPVETLPTIPAIKGMDKDMQCRGFQFVVGETYSITGDVKACKSGFHACPVDDDTAPHAVFEYYTPANSRYFEVTASGKTDRDGNKIASASITIGVELTLGELMARVAKWCVAKAKGAASNSGDYGAASNSGSRGAASNSGSRGAASNSGDYGAASNSGSRGAASNSGSRGAASNSGDYGAASNSGSRGAASNSGYCGAASNSGDYGAASNSGSRGAASNSGTGGAALNSGYGGAALNSGTGGAALNSGYGGAAFSHAYRGKVKSDVRGVICASEFSGSGDLLSVASGIAGEDGLECGVWYVCKGGKLVKA